MMTYKLNSSLSNVFSLVSHQLEFPLLGYVRMTMASVRILS